MPDPNPLKNYPRNPGVYEIMFSDGTTWWLRYLGDGEWQKLHRNHKHLKVVRWVDA